MTAREWMERNFGRRPTSLPPAQAKAKVRTLTSLRSAAIRQCTADEIWDARLEAVERMMRVGRAK